MNTRHTAGALGCRAVWYRLEMLNRHVTLATLLTLTACGDDPVDVCTDNIEPLSLPLFAACDSRPQELNMPEKEQCAVGRCSAGWCAEPCKEDDDCLTFGTTSGVCAGGLTCIYTCTSDADCPDLGGLQLQCSDELVPFETY